MNLLIPTFWPPPLPPAGGIIVSPQARSVQNSDAVAFQSEGTTGGNVQDAQVQAPPSQRAAHISTSTVAADVLASQPTNATDVTAPAPGSGVAGGVDNANAIPLLNVNATPRN